MNQENNSFNLVTEGWIPVTDLQGNYHLISLLEVFTNGKNYADLVVRPHERVSLMRLLLCISHAALDGPENLEEWEKVPEVLPQAAKAYLEKWKDSFDLFHPEKPFLQIAKLNNDEKAKSSKASNDISKLDYALATGDNPTLFDHEGTNEKRIIPKEKVALMLLTYQNFSVGGLIAMMKWNGVNTSTLKGTAKVPSSKTAPCAPRSMLHAFVRKDNIINTIHNNLPTKKQVQLCYGELEVYWGKPIWEHFPIGPKDIESIRNATTTYLGRLTPLSRSMKLDETNHKLMLGDGLTYPAFTDDGKKSTPYHVPEPTATVKVTTTKDNKIEYTILSYDSNMRIWRELSALCTKREGRKGGPLCLELVSSSNSFDFQVVALASNKASILDMVDSIYHVPAQMLQDVGRSSYENEVRYAKSISIRLGRAIESYRKVSDGGWEGRVKSAGPSKGKLKAQLHSIATTHFWTTVENSLSVLMDHVKSIGTTAEQVDSTRKDWHKVVWSAARESYELVCGRDTPRQMRAFAFGWQVLNKPEKAEEESNEEENNNEEEDSL
jgi:CRISPR system Cascade subunit CasA